MTPILPSLWWTLWTPWWMNSMRRVPLAKWKTEKLFHGLRYVIVKISWYVWVSECWLSFLGDSYNFVFKALDNLWNLKSRELYNVRQVSLFKDIYWLNIQGLVATGMRRSIGLFSSIHADITIPKILHLTQVHVIHQQCVARILVLAVW